MEVKILFVLLISNFLYFGCDASQQEGIQKKRSEILDDRYRVEWQANFGEGTIDFWIDAITTGYVGFGLSPAGTMNGADIVIGGVADSKPYFKDYHGEGNSPIADTSQDWEAVNITEINGHTYMHIRRKLDTCDIEDIKIEDGTMKFIYSIGKTDAISRHELRDALAVNILDPPLAAKDLSEFKTVNITQTITVTSNQSTLYWCTLLKIPAANKTHIVAFKPKLDAPNAKKLTHHFNMFRCIGEPGIDDDAFFGPALNPKGENCFETSEEFTRVRSYCTLNFYAWSLGGRMLVFPDNIGLPWGTGKNEYYVFEVHADNQKLETLTFETGITIYQTHKTREIEAGLLAIGHSTSSSLLIPPGTSNWTIAGHCSSPCTRDILGDKEINIFNVNLHAHMSGRKIKLRQFRNGTELPWIARDDTYDFDFQENRPIAHPVKILGGDQITIECTFDSNWKKPAGAIIGGISSYDEMCMVFAFYYPRSDLDYCFSNHPIQPLFNRFGILEAISKRGSQDAIIQKPDKWANRTFTSILDQDIKWNASYAAELQHELRFGHHEEYCSRKIPGIYSIKNVNVFARYSHTPKSEPNVGQVGYPERFQEYIEESTCKSSGIGMNLSNIVVVTFIGMIFTLKL